MQIPTIISRHAADWLRERPELVEGFARALARVRADERSLLAHSFAIKEPDLPHMLRYFLFDGGCLAVIEWNPHTRRIKVLRCRRVEPSSEV